MGADLTTFLRLLVDDDKQSALLAAVQMASGSLFEVMPAEFLKIPGAPFAYWVSEAVRDTFQRFPPFEGEGRTVKQGLATADDFRFLRLWWEVAAVGKWFTFAKGGAFSPFYAEISSVVNWGVKGDEINNNLNEHGVVRSNIWMLQDTVRHHFLHPGLSYPPTALGNGRKGLGMYVLPRGCYFGHKACTVFRDGDDEEGLLSILAVLSSGAIDYLMRVLSPTRSWEVGHLRAVPQVAIDPRISKSLAELARRAWSLGRTCDTVTETSHAFLLPSALRKRQGDKDLTASGKELAEVQVEIDAIAFEQYGFSEVDRRAASIRDDNGKEATFDDQDNDVGQIISSADSLLSWAVGVAFGRFDWRLATGERGVPPEPEPFDPLPAKSPGMLPDGAEPFRPHAGILVDDPGHPHDLVHIVEEVLERVDAPVPDDVRRWLQRDFFPFHLQRYSKSRRKVPIYWPLSTPSCSYTLWIYYPSLSSQTLYTAVNDFVEPKLKRLRSEVAGLVNKGASRSHDDEKQLERLQTIEQELVEMRDALLEIAQHYRPNHDDGVQITAAPLWPLFRHKPWQQVLKDTLVKLEKGDYDWAHLAMDYWPDRVRENCKTDKSLAIAHDLQELYVEPILKSTTSLGRKIRSAR